MISKIIGKVRSSFYAAVATKCFELIKVNINFLPIKAQISDNIKPLLGAV